MRSRALSLTAVSSAGLAAVRMRRHRGSWFGLQVVLAGCSPAATASPIPPSATATPVPSVAAVATIVPTAVPVTPPPGLMGRLVFARFTEASHTFNGTFRTAADGSGEVEVPMPWTEGGGRWSTAGDLIAIPTQLADGRVGTAIIDVTGKVVRVLEIASKGLNLPCTKWSPDDKRLACEGWDESDATRTGIYTVRSKDGGDLKRVTTWLPLPGANRSSSPPARWRTRVASHPTASSSGPPRTESSWSST